MAASSYTTTDNSEDDSFNLYLGDLGLGLSLRSRGSLMTAKEQKDPLDYLYTIYENIKRNSITDHCGCCKCLANGFSSRKSSGTAMSDDTLKDLESRFTWSDYKPNIKEDLHEEVRSRPTAHKIEYMLKNTLKEVNDLQFQLECTQGLLEDSQSRWAQRFDCCSKERDIIWTGLQDCVEELRKLTAIKAALERQRDELMAYIDVKEKLMYDDDVKTLPENYSTFTSQDLVVLAACNCRDHLQRPCTCALAACEKQREIQRLKQENQELKQKYNDASALANAYRWAFEEQLNNNKVLLHQMAALSLKSNKRSNVVGKFNKFKKQNSTKDKPPNTKLDSDIVNVADIMADLLMDKIEALAHQRMLSKILATKVQDLEEHLKKLSGHNRIIEITSELKTTGQESSSSS